MSFVVEARMDAIKRMSNEKRAHFENEITYITEKIERFGHKFTPGQRADWSHILKFRQMELALDDLAVLTLEGAGTRDIQKMMDDAFETIRLYHASTSMRRREKQVPISRQPDSPYVRTEIFIPCEKCQPFPYASGEAMLATLLPSEEHVGQPTIVFAREHRCSGEQVDHWRGSYYRCDNDDDPDCPQYNPLRQEQLAAQSSLADQEDLYA